MIDPISLFAIAGSIAALVSGFRDAKDLFSKWVKKRRDRAVARKQLELNNALEESPRIAQGEYNRGHERFGSRFASGDDIARSSMTQTLIRMNEQLIAVLKSAITATSFTCINCERLYSAAVNARQETSRTFAQLTQRLLASVPIPRIRLSANPAYVRPMSAPYFVDSGDRLPISTYAPEPDRGEATRRLSTSTRPQSPSLFPESPLPTIKPLPVINTTDALRQNLLNMSMPNSPVLSSPVTRQRVTVDNLESSLPKISNYGFAAASVPWTPSTSDNIPARNSWHAGAMANDTNLPIRGSTTNRYQPRGKSKSLQPTGFNPQPPRRSRTWDDSGRPHTSYNAATPQFSSANVFNSSGKYCDPRTQVDEWAEKTTTQTLESIAELPGGIVADTIYELDSRSIDNDSASSPNLFRTLYPTATPPAPWASPPRRKTQPQTRLAPSMVSPTPPRIDTSKTSLPQTELSANTTPFCPAALYLQKTPGSRSPPGSDPLCPTCSSRIPSKGFSIHLPSTRDDDDGGDSDSSSETDRPQTTRWDVSPRFLAKCHKPSAANGVTAQLCCVLCPGGAAQTFRGRNELWAHLEGHSAREVRSDSDIYKAVGGVGGA